MQNSYAFDSSVFSFNNLISMFEKKYNIVSLLKILLELGYSHKHIFSRQENTAPITITKKLHPLFYTLILLSHHNTTF